MKKNQKSTLKKSLSVGAIFCSLFAIGCESRPKVRTTTSVVDRYSTQLQGTSGIPLEAVVSRNLMPSVTLRFPTDSDQLDIYSQKKLIGFVNNLGKKDLQRLAVFGFADRRGTANYNDGLSNRRAKTVAEWLLNNGIEANDYEVEGFGELYVPKLSKARIVQVRVVE